MIQRFFNSKPFYFQSLYVSDKDGRQRYMRTLSHFIFLSANLPPFPFPLVSFFLLDYRIIKFYITGLYNAFMVFLLRGFLQIHQFLLNLFLPFLFFLLLLLLFFFLFTHVRPRVPTTKSTFCDLLNLMTRTTRKLRDSTTSRIPSE